MTARTAICIGLAAMFLLGMSAVAIAAGTYEGHAVDDPRVEVSFVKDGRLVKRFTIERAKFFCTDGDHFRSSIRVGRMRIRDDGHFGGRFTTENGSVLADVRGELARRTADGEFRLITVFRGARCSTRDVPWTAARR